jgi:hypothetical protein
MTDLLPVLANRAEGDGEVAGRRPPAARMVLDDAVHPPDSRRDYAKALDNRRCAMLVNGRCFEAIKSPL